MIIDDNKRKILTEYLGECWHSQETWYDCDNATHCKRRTFDNRNDLMDLYEAIQRKDDFWEYEKYYLSVLRKELSPKSVMYINSIVTTLLFCLDGKGYDVQCNFVAKYLEMKNGRKTKII